MTHESGPQAKSSELAEHQKQELIRRLEETIRSKEAEIAVLKESLSNLRQLPVSNPSVPDSATPHDEDESAEDVGVDPYHEDAGVHEVFETPVNIEARQREERKRIHYDRFMGIFGGFDLIDKGEQPKIYGKIMGRIIIHPDIAPVANMVVEQNQKTGITTNELLRRIFSACLEKSEFTATKYMDIIRQERLGDLDSILQHYLELPATNINALRERCKSDSALEAAFQNAKRDFVTENKGVDISRGVPARPACKIMARNILRGTDYTLRARLLQVCDLA